MTRLKVLWEIDSADLVGSFQSRVDKFCTLVRHNHPCITPLWAIPQGQTLPYDNTCCVYCLHQRLVLFAVLCFINQSYSLTWSQQLLAEMDEHFLYLLSRRSWQREQLSALILFVCLFVCLSVCCQNTKMQFSQKLSILELWCLLTTYRKSYMGFSKNPLLDP